jgi:hypothetical protein
MSAYVGFWFDLSLVPAGMVCILFRVLLGLLLADMLWRPSMGYLLFLSVRSVVFCGLCLYPFGVSGTLARKFRGRPEARPKKPTVLTSHVVCCFGWVLHHFADHFIHVLVGSFHVRDFRIRRSGVGHGSQLHCASYNFLRPAVTPWPFLVLSSICRP